MAVKCNSTLGGNTIFQKIYVCFAALKKGFNEGCISITGLDGCHVISINPGKLLATLKVDGTTKCTQLHGQL